MNCACETRTLIGSPRYCRHVIDRSGTLLTEMHRIGLPEQRLDDYAKFITLKVLTQDYDAETISPMPEIDQVWHMHILDTRNYQAMCQRVPPGNFIHHSPSNAWNNDAAKALRLDMMKTFWKHHFGDGDDGNAVKEIKEEDGNYINIHVIWEQEERESIVLRVQDSICIKTLTEGAVRRFGLEDPDNVRLAYNGHRLDAPSTLQDYGIEDGDWISLIFNQIGC
jgi:hypothetical protein